MRVSPVSRFAGFLALAVGLVAGCTTASSSTRSGFSPVAIDFGADPAGALPPGFTTALTGGGGPASWVVRADATAPGGKALVQESRDDTSYRFPLCVYDGIAAPDVSATVRFKAIAGEVDQAAGIVLRYHPETYYIARANALEGNLDIFKTVHGKRVLVQEVPLTCASGEWHTLEFSVAGDRLTAGCDGKVLISVADDAIAGPGQVALWTKADSVSAFDHLTIAPAP